MEAILQKAELVEKENIGQLHFPQTEVVTDEAARKLRLKDLSDATILGNIEHNKVKIVFEDDKSVKYTETTIWAVGDNNIVLKSGITIPLHRIHRIII
ncbi:MAG: hypothetical protein POELPBGB_00200 [Bacteroidia bacterium]|nr:hypothetical protein [Bacteroidia bacterium]